MSTYNVNKLIQGGATLIDFMDLTNYAIFSLSPDLSPKERLANSKIVFDVRGASNDAMIDNFIALNRVLLNAFDNEKRLRRNSPYTPIFLQAALSGQTNTLQSEVFEAVYTPPANWFAKAMVASRLEKAEIALSHRPYFEEASAVALQGSPFTANNNGALIRVSAAGSGSVTGVVSYGGICQITTSSAHGLIVGDWVTISGVGGTTEANGTFQVYAIHGGFPTIFDINVAFVHTFTSAGTWQAGLRGDLPSPVKLTVRAGNAARDRIVAAVRGTPVGTPANFLSLIEAESYSDKGTGVADLTDAGFSPGSGVSGIKWTPTVTTEQLLARYKISSNVIDQLGAQRIFAAVRDNFATPNIAIHIKPFTYSGSTYQYGDFGDVLKYAASVGARVLIDCGVIIPGGVDTYGVAPLGIGFEVWGIALSKTGTTPTMDIDWLLSTTSLRCGQ